MGNRQVTSVRARPTKAKAKAALGPGLHGGTVEIIAGDAMRVRTASGERFEARAGDHVERGLIEECLRMGRMVVLADSPEGPLIVGALQTTRSVAHDADGTLEVDAKDIRLRAARSFVIEAAGVALRADATGVLRFEGDRMIVDVSSLVRFLSARVELP